MTVQQDVIFRLALNKAEYDRLKSGLSSIQAGIGTLRSALATLGVSLSIGALVGFVRGAANAASATRELADSVGLTTAQLSALTFAGRQNGATQEDLAKAIFRINELLNEGANAGSKAAAILAKYGITSEQITDGSVGTMDALRAIADRFNSLPDGIEKSALASELLGSRLGQRLIPFLNLGSGGLEEFAKKGTEAGAVLDDKVADAVVRANDKLSAFYQTLQTKVLGGLAALLGLSEAFEKGFEATPGDNRIDELRKKIDALNASIEHLENKKVGFGNAGAIEKLKGQLQEAQKELDDLIKKQLEVPPGPKPDKPKPVAGAVDKEAQALAALEKELRDVGDEEDKAIIRRERLEKLYREGSISVKRYREEIKAMSEAQALAALEKELRGVGDEEDKAAIRRARLTKLFREKRISGEQYREELAAMAGALDVVADSEENLAGVQETAQSNLDVFADQAARNIQGITASLIAGEITGKNFADSIVNGLKRIAAELAAQALLKQIFGGLAGSDNAFLSAIGVAFGGAKTKKARGGYVSGPGGPTDDTILALLSNGEYVIQASAVRRLGKNFLDMINAGMPVRDTDTRFRFATGGMVGGANGVVSRAMAAVNIENNIDASGVSAEMLPVLTRLLRESEQRTKAQVFEAIRRGTNP